MLRHVVGCGTNGVPHFSKAAGTNLSRTKPAEAIAKHSKGEDLNLLKFYRVKEINLLTQVNSAIWQNCMQAAVNAYAKLAQSAIGVMVAGKTTSPEGCDLVTPSLGQ